MDYLKVQHAGEIGYIAMGFGKKITKTFSFECFSGFVPKDIGGNEIETFAIKNLFYFFEYENWDYYSQLYFGASVYHVSGLRNQTSRHSSFPSEYYRLGSIRALMNLGIKLESSSQKKHFGYFEAGLNDIAITNYINNQDVINPFDFVSLGIGYGRSF